MILHIDGYSFRFGVAAKNKKLALYHKPSLNWLAMRPAKSRGTACDCFFMEELLSASPLAFDPSAVVVDWLDAGHSGKLPALLDLYDEGATLDCHCEAVTLNGRKSLAAYWGPKLENKLGFAFTLDELALIGDSVQVDYLGYEGKPLRLYFHFGPSGKILHTSCRARGCWEA